MKLMADHIGISSSHMSGIEYGAKTLSDHHIELTLDFFSKIASQEDLKRIENAANASKEFVNISTLEPDAKELVAAFARRLQPSPCH